MVIKVIITLKDGSSKEYEAPMSVIDIAADISEGLARVACAGEIDGEVVDLSGIAGGKAYGIPRAGRSGEKALSRC